MAVKKNFKNIEKGKVYVTATFNNTLVAITDSRGDVLAWNTAGSSGFRGARKSTPYAASVAVDNAARKAIQMGLREAEVYIKGPGAGRDAALRALKNAGLNISLIADVTPIPHNGVRPKKRRRV